MLPRHFSRAPAVRASCVLGANVLGPLCPTCVMRNQTELCGRWVAGSPDHGGAGPHAGPGGGLPRPHRGGVQQPGRTRHPPVPPGIHCHCCYHKRPPNQFASSSPPGGRPCYFSPRLIRDSTIRKSRWPLSIDRSSLVVRCLSMCGRVFEVFLYKKTERPPDGILRPGGGDGAAVLRLTGAVYSLDGRHCVKVCARPSLPAIYWHFQELMQCLCLRCRLSLPRITGSNSRRFPFFCLYFDSALTSFRLCPHHIFWLPYCDDIFFCNANIIPHLPRFILAGANFSPRRLFFFSFAKELPHPPSSISLFDYQRWERVTIDLYFSPMIWFFVSMFASISPPFPRCQNRIHLSLASTASVAFLFC